MIAPLLLACLGRDPGLQAASPPAAPLPATSEPAVSTARVFHLRAPEDAPAVTAAVMEAVHGDAPLPAVELVLHGELHGLSLQVGGELDPRRVDLRVRGEGAVLRQAVLDLSAETLVLADLRLEGPQRSVKLQAGRRLEVEGLRVRGLPAGEGGHPGSRSPSGIRLRALGPEVRAELRGLVLLDNGQSPVLRLEAAPGARFAELALRGGRLGGNQAPEFELGPVAVVRVEDVERVGPGEWLHADSAASVIMAEPRAVDAARLALWRAEP